MLTIKKMWTQVKFRSKQKELGRWKLAPGVVVEADEEDEDEGREWIEHKRKVRQDYQREMSQIRWREQKKEEMQQQERREMELWQRKERAEMRKALREQEAQSKRPPAGAEPGHQSHLQTREVRQAEASFMSTIRFAWQRAGKTRVAPSQTQQLNWFNPLDGEKAAT